MMNSFFPAEESAPLNTELSSSSNATTPHDNREDRRRSNNFFFSSFTQRRKSSQTDICNNDEYDGSSGGIGDIAISYTDYQHSHPLRKGKYQGYCALGTAASDDGVGRISMLDDWDFSPQQCETNYNDSGSDDDGHFVSYWGHSSDNDDDQSSSSSYGVQNEKKAQHHTISNSMTANKLSSIDDRVETTVRPIPLIYRQYQGGSGRGESISANKGVTTTSPRNNRNRRGESLLLSLPIVRPFIRRSHQGFSDQANQFQSNDEDGEYDDHDDCNNISSSKDRVVMMQSISDGIKGTHNKDPTLQHNSSAQHSSADSSDAPNSPPNKVLGRIFFTRFIQIPLRNQEEILLRQLHDLLRKEDWSLATELLESKPMLARKWHCVKRLYGGKFDSEALPIHSACALCPPASFIQTLVTLYPEGLLMKEKAFGRIPLHIACRSLADSSVVKVLCETEPRSVIERDSLKRAPLHYMIKNYNTFGEDEGTEKKTKDKSMDDSNDNNDKTADGFVALKLLVETNIDCVKVADHRGWIPLHVACSCSARQGMINVIEMLMNWWPESVNVKTEKNSDVFACVDMAGKHHSTKDAVVALLKEAKQKSEMSKIGEENEVCSSPSNVIDTPPSLGFDSPLD